PDPAPWNLRGWEVEIRQPQSTPGNVDLSAGVKIRQIVSRLRDAWDRNRLNNQMGRHQARADPRDSEEPQSRAEHLQESVAVRTPLLRHGPLPSRKPLR